MFREESEKPTRKKNETFTVQSNGVSSRNKRGEILMNERVTRIGETIEIHNRCTVTEDLHIKFVSREDVMFKDFDRLTCKSEPQTICRV